MTTMPANFCIGGLLAPGVDPDQRDGQGLHGDASGEWFDPDDKE
jgi:hypothetical protein